MKDCKTIEPLLSEYVNGTLTPQGMWEVQSHIVRCAACAKIAGEFEALTEMLHSVPQKETSTGFEESLAGRIAELPRPAAQRRFSLRGLIEAYRLSPGLVLRPVLALATACVAMGGFLIVGHIRTASTDNSDASLVSQCVEQHRLDAASQPLSDISAQDLSARQDAQNSDTEALLNGSSQENL